VRSNQLEPKGSVQLGYRRQLNKDVDFEVSKGTSPVYSYGADVQMRALGDAAER